MNLPKFVLVVDFDSEFSARITRILQQATEFEYQVSVCRSGEDALLSCRWQHYDCIMLDFAIPDMSGKHFAQQLNNILSDDVPPIIMMASYDIREAATQAVRIQATDFFNKADSNRHSVRRSVRNAIEKGQLENRIRERHRELMLANKELERQAIEIQRFYHTVSHEIKTPLAAAREFVSLVDDGLLGPVNEKQSEILKHAVVCCDQISRQFNDMMDLTRLETGKLALDLAPSDLSEIIARVIAMMSSSAEDKGVTLDQRVPESLPLVDMDAGRIAQVLSNLMGNAIKFTPRGGCVRLSTRVQENGLVQVRVSDSGCGIPKADLENVFDRLFQVESARMMDSQSGLGLGLSIAREIIRGHGQTLTANSRVNRGSVFTFSLVASAAQTLDRAA